MRRVRRRNQCIGCLRDAMRDNSRCAECAEVNRARSLAWREAHPRARRKLKMRWRKIGRCDLCPQHRKLTGLHTAHCKQCLRRFARNTRNRNAGIRAMSNLLAIHTHM